MTRMTRIWRLVSLSLVLLTLALAGPSACGKRGDLKPPDGKPATYPRSYPSS
ncbi:MAG: hypothetical protein HQ481_05790 [Alphaproteobacteria bacterium]|nr:hypothetical protein [Alphaproteobacteria bacterium]